MKKLYAFAAAALVGLFATAQTYPDMYIIGSDVNGKSWTLAASDAKMTNNGDGTYTWTGTKLGTGFKFNNGTWGNDSYNFGGPVNNAPKLVLGQDYAIVASGSSSNIAFADVTEVESPTVTLDINKKICKVVGAGSGEVEWFIPGLSSSAMALDDAHKFSSTTTDGVYELKNFVVSSTGEFAVASTGWSEKYGTYGALTFSASNLSAELETVFAESGNVPYTMTGTFDITWNYNTKTLTFTPQGEVVDPDPVDPDPDPATGVLYFVGDGSINGTNLGWDPANPYVLEGTDNVYTFTYVGNKFKVSPSKGDWDTFNNNGFCLDGRQDSKFSTSDLGKVINLYWGSSQDMELPEDATYNVTITVNGSNNQSLSTIYVVKEGDDPDPTPNDWYLVGINGNWDFSDTNKFSATGTDNEYEIAAFEVTESTGSFQVSTEDYASQWGGSDNSISNSQLSTTLSVGGYENDAKYDLTVGTYKVTWNDATHVITFTMTSSSIENIGAEAAAAPAEYLDIYGRKVSEPKGLVIKVQDGKASKVIL